MTVWLYAELHEGLVVLVVVVEGARVEGGRAADRRLEADLEGVQDLGIEGNAVQELRVGAERA